MDTTENSKDLHASAIVSDCGRYRYTLVRCWNQLADASRMVMWVMLNPSTADATQDDPTVRRCIGFSKRWGYDGLMVVNLFAYRTPRPLELWRAGKWIDIVGPDNDVVIEESAKHASKIVLAWGGGVASLFRSRRDAVLKRLAAHDLYHLGVTIDGHPRHPLYVGYAATLEKFSP